jgi:hypothetical protein
VRDPVRLDGLQGKIILIFGLFFLLLRLLRLSLSLASLLFVHLLFLFVWVLPSHLAWMMHMATLLGDWCNFVAGRLTVLMSLRLRFFEGSLFRHFTYSLVGVNTPERAKKTGHDSVWTFPFDDAAPQNC